MKISIYGSVLLLCLLCVRNSECDVKISTHDIELTEGQNKTIFLEISNYNDERDIKFIIQHIDIVHVEPNPVPVNQPNISLAVKAVGPGHSEVYADDTNRVELEDVYFRITVNKEPFLDIISTVIGWIYFAAWSISFYPQIYTNYKRKSVVGLNFDFLALNLIGFSLYSIFNIGLYSINGIKAEYFQRNPRGLNPVQLNDIFFAVHAVLATLITIVQCCIYQREEQKVSLTAKGIVTVFALFLFGSTILALTDVIHWLDLLYYCSYVKLTITLIKYVPQAYMNYKRKSTVGWSIGNIFLDFTGGILSVLQMILNAYNYDDWASIFGDPTKFGLGFFSVIFDIFFIIQHYVLYRHTNYEENP